MAETCNVENSKHAPGASGLTLGSVGGPPFGIGLDVSMGECAMTLPDVVAGEGENGEKSAAMGGSSIPGYLFVADKVY